MMKTMMMKMIITPEKIKKMLMTVVVVVVVVVVVSSLKIQCYITFKSLHPLHQTLNNCVLCYVGF